MSQGALTYRDILHRFCEEKIQFAVIGGFALIAHGIVRVTMDLDLAVHLDTSSLKKAWTNLKNLGFVSRQPMTATQFSDPKSLIKIAQEKGAKAISFHHEKSPYLIVDVLFTEEFQLKASEIVHLDLFGVRVPVVSIEKLIELKKIAGRPKDLEDIHAIEKAQKKK